VTLQQFVVQQMDKCLRGFGVDGQTTRASSSTPAEASIDWRTTETYDYKNRLSVAQMQTKLDLQRLL